MIKTLLKNLKKPAKKPTSQGALYDFVRNTSSADKKKVLKEVVKKVNKEQRTIYYGK